MEGKSDRKKRRTISQESEGRIVEAVDEIGNKDDKGSKQERLEAGESRGSIGGAGIETLGSESKSVERTGPQEASKHEGYGQSYGRQCFYNAPPAKTSEVYGCLEMQGIRRICTCQSYRPC